MNKKYYDLLYSILSQYQRFPDVADTLKSVMDGIDHLCNYPQNDWDFMHKQTDIITYIVKARTDNLIYMCRNAKVVPIPITLPPRKLNQLNRMELFIELEDAVLMLKLKGLHQIITQENSVSDSQALAEEILNSDTGTVILKYGLSTGYN